VLAGGGLCRVPYYQVCDLVAAGALEIVLAPFELAPMPISAIHLSARYVSSKVRLFIDSVAATVNWSFI
jgi:DNA-binding transcriptional LysR family regulator